MTRVQIGVRRGDVWLADLPELEAHPVVLLEPTERMARRRRVLVAMVTSQVTPHRATEIAVSDRNGLDHPSCVKADELYTIGVARLIEHLGALESEQLQALDAALRLALGLG